MSAILRNRDGRMFAMPAFGGAVKTLDTIYDILERAALELVVVEAITLGCRSFEALHMAVCSRHGVDYDPDAKELQIHGPLGYVTIRKETT